MNSGSAGSNRASTMQGANRTAPTPVSSRVPHFDTRDLGRGFVGSESRDRTCDHRINSAPLCQLSYLGMC